MNGPEWTTIQKKSSTESTSKPMNTLWSNIVVASGAMSNVNPKVAAQAVITARQVKVTLQGDTGKMKIEMDNKTLKKIAQDTIMNNIKKLFQIRTIERWVKNNSVIIEMFTDKGASRLRQNIFTEKLTKAWGIKYTPKRHSLVAKFIPVDTNLDKEMDNIMEDNHLTKENLHEIKWMKAIGCCYSTQKVVNLLIVVNDETTANDLWARGLILHSVRRQVEKLVQEPIRCHKCQLYRHMVRDCRQKEETCAYCCKTHRSNQCKNPDKKICRPCGGKEGHTAKDRICPTYQKKCQEYNERNPSNALPCFPTSELWTWTGGSNTQHNEDVRPAWGHKTLNETPPKSPTPSQTPPGNQEQTSENESDNDTNANSETRPQSTQSQ